MDYDRETGIAWIEESDLKDWRLPMRASGLTIGSSEHTPFDEQVFAKKIKRRWFSRVDMIAVLHDSQMTSAWVAALFPKLEKLELCGRKIESIEEIASLKRLKWLGLGKCKLAEGQLDILPGLKLDVLEIELSKRRSDLAAISRCQGLRGLRLVKWPWPDFRGLEPLEVEYIQCFYGAMTTCEGLGRRVSDSVHFDHCQKLQSVVGVDVPRLDIDSCNQLDLETLCSVESLHDLSLRRMKPLISFEFVRGCRNIEILTLCANKTRGIDLSPIVGSKSLRRFWMTPGLTDKPAIELSKANENLVVTNAMAYYFRGKEVPAEQFWRPGGFEACDDV